MANISFNQVLIIIMGLIAAATVLYISRITTVQKPADKRVKEMVGADTSSIFDRGSENVLDRFGISLKTWKVMLDWAQLGDAYKSWSVGGIFFRGVALAAVLVVYLIFLPAPTYVWLFVPILAFLPMVMVRGKADDTKRKVKRLLPETVTVIAAEMDAGSTAAQALSRSAELPSPFGRILNRVVSKATQEGRSIFSHGSNTGVLLEEMEHYNMQELTRFALQIDRVASKGVDAPKVMVDIARGLAREYRSHVQQTAANMDIELLFPMTLFFFLPFLVVILMPVLTAFASAF